jgi:hypothetical protein
MDSEARTCQNCKQTFTVEPEDFQFYEKIKVPPPTWCPDCRHVRRFLFRNERSLYRRECDMCKTGILSIYAQDAEFPVYCRECWYSDKWSALDYGRDYDFSRPFFEQFRELLRVVPRLGLVQIKSTNSLFANQTLEAKNAYLSYSVVNAEDIMYSKAVDKSHFVVDSFQASGMEYCYENILSTKNSNSSYMLLTEECLDSAFLYDCVNCRSCFMCSNLQNKQYCIRNQQYSKEEYEKKIAEMDLGSAASIASMREEFREMTGKALHKYAIIFQSSNCTGNEILNVKNGRLVFDCYDAENIAYGYRIFMIKDSMDSHHTSQAELIYEYTTGGKNNYNVRFTYAGLEGVRDAEYCFLVASVGNVFGCVGLRSAKNCIFNKQYSEEEYAALREKIKKHMDEMPWTDSKARIYKYGEFLPLELAGFGYNETVAQEYFPLSKAEALSKGYPWKDSDPKTHVASKKPEELPDRIQDTDDSILNESIGCVHEGKCNHLCTVAFKLISDELQFYKQKGIPVPRMCPNCRHYARLAQVDPMKLWDGKCDCAGTESGRKAWKNTAPHFHGTEPCPNIFKTPHPPEHQEILYCEKCYQAEVA